MSTLSLKKTAKTACASETGLSLYRVIVAFHYEQGIIKRFERFYECVSSEYNSKLFAYFSEVTPIKHSHKCSQQWVESFEKIPRNTPHHHSSLYTFDIEKWEGLERMVEIEYEMPDCEDSEQFGIATLQSDRKAPDATSKWVVKAYEAHSKELELVKMGCRGIKKKYVS